MRWMERVMNEGMERWGLRERMVADREGRKSRRTGGGRNRKVKGGIEGETVAPYQFDQF